MENSAKITFTNEPKLSEHTADEKINQKKIILVPQVENYLVSNPLFKNKEIAF